MIQVEARMKLPKILEQLHLKSEKELTTLETNARRFLEQDERRAEAELVLERAGEERLRRVQAAKVKAADDAELIRKEVAGKDLRQRAIVAFERVPLLEWEHHALRIVYAHPGATMEQLSRAMNYSGAYINMAFGNDVPVTRSVLGRCASLDLPQR
jgi:hypothetical protein